MPFEGIFSRGYAQGKETSSVIEPSVIVAFVVLRDILLGELLKLIHLLSRNNTICK
jgi:hypothetical protein